MPTKPRTRFSASPFLFMVLALSLFFGGCAQSRNEGPSSAPSQPRAPEAAGGNTSSLAQGEQAIERIVVKNASLSLVVDDPSASMDRVRALAEEMGGYVVSADLSQEALENGGQSPYATITVRVPVEHLDEALARIRSESKQLPLSETLNSEDVTADYTDLQSRLRNLEAAEAQLTKIMEQADKTEDVLAVYQQLVSTREQIEVTKGRIQFYENSAALSAVRVELHANEAVQPLTIGTWQPQGVARGAVRALISALKFLANAVIWIVLFFLPVALVLFIIFILPLILVWRFLRRRRRAAPPLPRPGPPAIPPAGPPAPPPGTEAP